jgi:hypothetical protein
MATRRRCTRHGILRRAGVTPHGTERIVSDWVCGRCKSINRERSATCYSCGGIRGAIQLETSSAAAPAAAATPDAAATFASGIPIAEVAAPPPAVAATMGDLVGGVIGGAIGAVLATAVWYGVVAITNWQVGIVAIAVGFIVGQGVVLGAGRHPSILLVPISLAFTLVSLVVSEYLIANHLYNAAVAEIAAEMGLSVGEVSDIAALAGVPTTPIELVRFSLESDPITLLFWAIAGWEAFVIPMRAATRSNAAA